MSGANQSMTVGDCACEYAECGLYVLPAKGKVPLIARGFKSASNDQAKVRDWWKRWPDATLAAASARTRGSR